jgi:drug/metabolite transporter (DMT)-like permease
MFWLYIVILFEQWVASGTFIAAKWALLDIPPLTLAFLRFLIASFGLAAIYRFWPGRPRIERRDWKWIVLLGFLVVFLNQALFLYGIKFTTPTHAALLYGATPVFVFLLAIPLIGEKPTWLKFVGVIVTFAGVAVVVSQKGYDFSGDTWLGDLMILGAVIAWALYTVMGKPLVAKYGAIHLNALVLIAGTILFIPFGIFTVGALDAGSVSTRAWLSLLYIAIGTSVIAYTIWFWALRRMEATKLSVFNNLQPIITGFLSFWLMDESIGVRLIVGGAMVIMGVILTERG